MRSLACTTFALMMAAAAPAHCLQDQARSPSAPTSRSSSVRSSSQPDDNNDACGFEPIAAVPGRGAKRWSPARAGYDWVLEQFTIHDTPKRSFSMPKRSAQNVSPIGITTAPPCDSSPKMRSASAG